MIFTPRGVKGFFLFLSVFIACLIYPFLSFAQSFTANTLGDYGNVTVMEVTGDYDGDNPDGSVNSAPREAIAKEFFRTHKDEYDFLVIFSNFNFKMPASEASAFYLHIKNDVQGIGSPLVDNSALFGSNGKLQGAIDMGNVLTYAVDPTNPNFEEPLDLLSHEVLHRWAAYVNFKDSSGNISTTLLGAGAAHWSFLLNSFGSVLYGNDWQDNGDGTFTSIATAKYYSPLDLYLMGFNDKTKVPPMLLIKNPAIAPTRAPELGATITGSPGYVSIDDIIAAEGERIPAAADSQKTFKTAFVFITTPGTFTGNELQGMENIRSGWVTRFSVLTNGQGIMQVTPTATANLPVNPGPVLPPVTPRTLPPNVNDGVNWLMANQKGDGSWMDLSQTANRDTAEAVLALKNFPGAQQNYSLGSQWLNGGDSGNTDYLSRKIEALAKTGQDLSALISLLVSGQNGDGGWGSNSTYVSNPTDTSFALGALSAAGYSNQTVISPAIAYLQAKQHADGGWGGDDGGSTIEATANVLAAFGGYRSAYQLETQITKGVAWLTQRQNPDGGFGNSPSTVYDSALAVLTLTAFNAAPNITNNGLNYILSQQSKSGSWNESPYQTALAINAVWKSAIEPDLSVKADDITFTPPSVSVLPSNIVMNVTMWNLGMTAVPQAKVALYNGSVSAANMIGEQTVAFPGQSSVTITFPLTITDGNEHTYYVVIDPDNLIQESNKANNTAVKVLNPQGTYDFQILPSNISASPNPANIFQDMTITSTVANLGTLDAYNVQVQYYLDNPKGALNIATSTVNIPAGGSVTNQVTWNASMAGDNLPLTVLVDPFSAFTELSKTNNKAAIPLTVLGSTEPNLTVSYQDIAITPNPANQGGNASISVIVRNQGFSAASNILVNFYEGTPGVDGVLVGSQTIPSLNAGVSSIVSVNWTNIPDSGEKIIYVQVDPNNLIQEISQNNKSAFVTLNILILPDLAISPSSITFSPAAPKVGDMVAISVNVKNLGAQSASNVKVRAYEGATVIGSQVIPTVASYSQASTLFTYDTTGKPGAHLITIVVDPDNAIAEQSKANNTASATFGVQNANMWVTEPYISPNGDGVQDSTQFFFSFDVPETVKIVVNGTNGTVRAFTGANLAHTTSGNITWDGMDDSGMVVADGQYQIRVINANNNDLGGLTVVVDNNRSPISDAAGTKYLLNINLTCPLPDITNWQWFPDESGILFNLQYPNKNTPQYPTGLYTMSPDGEAILRIVPQDWTQGVDYSIYDYYFDAEDISADGGKVAFILDKCSRPGGQYLQSNQIWVVGKDGTNLTLLDSPNLAQMQIPYVTEGPIPCPAVDYLISYIKWSPTGEYITYMGGYPPELWIVKSDGTGKTLIDPNDGRNIDVSSVRWSPDGTRIAYLANTYDAQGNSVAKIRIADVSGNRQDIFSTTFLNGGFYLEWLNDATIIASMDNNLWLIDGSGAGNNQTLSTNYQGSISVSPDGKSFVFATSAAGIAALNVSDSLGNTNVLYDFAFNTPCVLQLDNVVWSPDSRRVAFIAGVGRLSEAPGCPVAEVFGPSLIITDKATKNVTSFAVAQSPLILYKWLYDGISIVGAYYDESGGHIAAINATTGAIVSVFSETNLNMPDQGNIVSPFEHYITYYNSVDPSSACYGNAYNDLWAISSLLNLTASLRTEQQKSAIILKGIAADLNFQQYLLEYADVNSPNSWNPIGPPSNVPVLNDVFTTWVPPYEGVFHVRLTVSDKAGNVATDMQRVAWGLTTSITNLYTNYNIFSPNGDGVKDTVKLYYTVLEPTHLEFDIYDQNSNLVTTILKDYTAPVKDSITWDGRDSSGNIVPDGTYDIRVFNFDFFVEVDNTPPDVAIHFTGLRQDVTQTGPGPIYTDVDGHAFDKKLKSWLVEYGEGDNPQNWYELAEGSDVLIGKDSQFNPILNPPMDVTIRSYIEGDIAFLIGKKLRITATDSAGNVSTAVTGYLEEKVILDNYDNTTINISSPDSIYPDLALPGQHTLGGIETFRAALSSANVQYWSADRQWLDATPVTNPLPGVLSLVWDNTVFGPSKAVRIKAVDILGVEHDSNAILIDKMFTYDVCIARAVNDLFEDTHLLKFQVKSDQDTRYTQWTDYQVFDASKGDIVPEGTFVMPIPNNLFKNLLPGYIYYFRMVGIGVSGATYQSNGSSYPCGPIPGSSAIVFSLPAPTYQEMGCGQLSNGQATLLAYFDVRYASPSLSFQSLSYFIQNAGGLQLLKQIDLTKEPWDGVTVNTLNMAEGSYTVKAVLNYVDSPAGNLMQLSAVSTLIVDRVLPTASITVLTTSLWYQGFKKIG